MFYFIFEKSKDFSFGFREIEEFDRKGKEKNNNIDICEDIYISLVGHLRFLRHFQLKTK